MKRSIGLPRASAAEHPNIFSAAVLNMTTLWSSSTVTIASIADSTTAETCASLSLRRAAASSNCAVRWRTAVSSVAEQPHLVPHQEHAGGLTATTRRPRNCGRGCDGFGEVDLEAGGELMTRDDSIGTDDPTDRDGLIARQRRHRPVASAC